MLATLVFLSSSIQGNHAATITVSTSLTILPSSTIQRNSTTNSLSYNATTVASLRTTTIVSSVFLTSSSSSSTKSLVASRYSKTKTWSQVSEATVSPTASISVNQYNYTAAPAMPTTVLIIKGLPSVEVVAAISGVLGVILLMLLAVIVSITTVNSRYSGHLRDVVLCPE